MADESKTKVFHAFATTPLEKRIWTKLDAVGGLVIPAELLRQAGLTPGDRVYVGVTREGLELLSQKSALNRAQEIAAPFKRPGVSEVDEFIAERRAEALREDENYEAERQRLNSDSIRGNAG